MVINHLLNGMILQVETLHPLRVARKRSQRPTNFRRIPWQLDDLSIQQGIPKKIRGKNVGRCSGNIHGASITLW